jgi:hypothetical protein
MAFVDCDDVVQQVTAAAFDPSLRDTVLPRALERGPHSSPLQGPHRCRNLDSIFAVTVKDKKARS